MWLRQQNGVRYEQEMPYVNFYGELGVGHEKEDKTEAESQKRADSVFRGRLSFSREVW